jgi:hypothetical protein
VTHSTIGILLCYDVEDWLPTISNSPYENPEFCPFTESDRVILGPTCCHLLDFSDITENLREVSLLPSDIFLEFYREIFILLYAFEVLVDRCKKWSCIGFLVETGRLILDSNTVIIECGVDLFRICIKGTSIPIKLLREYPWDIHRYSTFRDGDEREFSDKLVCCTDRRDTSLSCISDFAKLSLEYLILNRVKRTLFFLYPLSEVSLCIGVWCSCACLESCRGSSSIYLIIIGLSCLGRYSCN